VRLAGGEDAEILVMTIATQEVSETIKDYRKAFRRLGARHVKGFDISLREDTTSKRGFRLIEESTGLFFHGRQSVGHSFAAGRDRDAKSDSGAALL
jgi:cyanophycinase